MTSPHIPSPLSVGSSARREGPPLLSLPIGVHGRLGRRNSTRLLLGDTTLMFGKFTLSPGEVDYAVSTASSALHCPHARNRLPDISLTLLASALRSTST